MERKIVLYIAMSLDGYIARINGSVDWLSGHGKVLEVDNGYEEFYNNVDTIIMGRVTYEQVVNELSPDNWVYEGKNCYVFTKKEYETNEKVEFISGSITNFVSNIKNQLGRDIWLVGGGKLIHEFVRENLVDKYVITVIPTILGDGIPLFIKENPEIKLELIETKDVDGMVELTYVRREK
ncbi:dihydrofolate reductase family protein [Clostridium sp. UBA7503]|uniref:dihydrofolate reductase family protein n=1 Tax=Clostridium sp. UBA7503 TaxID=1946377 RepID=UPI0032163F4B